MKLFVAALLAAASLMAMSDDNLPRDPDGGIHRSPAVLAEFQRLYPCPSTGRPTGPCPGNIKDHKRPLCSGGVDEVANLMWSEKWYAKLRDKQEWELCRFLKKEGPIYYKEDPKRLCAIVKRESLVLLANICPEGVAQ